MNRERYERDMAEMAAHYERAGTRSDRALDATMYWLAHHPWSVCIAFIVGIMLTGFTLSGCATPRQGDMGNDAGAAIAKYMKDRPLP